MTLRASQLPSAMGLWTMAFYSMPRATSRHTSDSVLQRRRLHRVPLKPAFALGDIPIPG
jgi:hypothetical protein